MADAEQALLIHVRDTGVGIAPEHLARIFDEFARLRNPEHDPNKGWGFGLAICRRLVEVISGAITVESQPNRGSVFTVRLAALCVVNRSAGGQIRLAARRVGRSQPDQPLLFPLAYRGFMVSSLSPPTRQLNLASRRLTVSYAQPKKLRGFLVH